MRGHSWGRASRRGFTLVEMMITVAIVGVLAVLAVVGYRKLIGSSKVTEATNVLGSIRDREFAVKAETTKFVTASSALATSASSSGYGSLYPHCAAGSGAPGAFKVAWGGTCTAETGWNKLAVQVSSPVYFGYTAVSGTGTPPALVINGGAITWPTPNGDWFVATAVGDTDGNGIYSMVVANSFDNEMRIDKEGE